MTAQCQRVFARKRNSGAGVAMSLNKRAHLPEQLYVREARRMVGMHIYVQRDSEHAPGDARATLHRDAIAMGDYGNNCHGTAHEGPRFGGTHTGEFYNSVPPYQIPYLALVPREVDNLLVPTAVSSSHVGFCALRLEPIWMVLGQAAGHACRDGRVPGCSRSSSRCATVATSTPCNRFRHHLCERCATWSCRLSSGAVVGLHGGLHGLHPMPEKPGQRGANLHGQYFAATPGHAAQLDNLLDDKNVRALASDRATGWPVGTIHTNNERPDNSRRIHSCGLSPSRETGPYSRSRHSTATTILAPSTTRMLQAMWTTLS